MFEIGIHKFMFYVEKRNQSNICLEFTKQPFLITSKNSFNYHKRGVKKDS
jgi:hypothetical protein